MKILLTGKNGQLGYELRHTLPAFGDVVAIGTTDCDLGAPRKIIRIIEQVKPDLIVNAAAYTAVDKAESEQDLAIAVNARAPKTLAAQANLLGIPLIHYSTDYVFDGAKEQPYEEGDLANPISVYGLSKWQGEQNVRAMCAQHLILRTSWVYGVHGSNFLKTVLNLAKEKTSLQMIDDQMGAPTSTRLLASVTAEFIKRLVIDKFDTRLYGTFHVVPDGTTTWCRYAQKIVAYAARLGAQGLLNETQILPIPTQAYPLPAARPKNACMSNKKIKALFDMAFPDWTQDIEPVLKALIQGDEHHVLQH